MDTPTTSHPMPEEEGSMTQGAHSDPSTPMEMGGVGDGQSWVEQVEAATEEEWRRDRPTKQLQTAFYWFLPCRDLLPVSLFCIRFPGFLVPRCALLFGEYL